MENLVKEVEGIWGYYYRFQYRGVEIHFDYAKIYSKDNNSGMINRYCSLWSGNGNDKLVKAYIDEYSVIDTIESSLPDEDIHMEEGLEKIRGSQQ